MSQGELLHVDEHQGVITNAFRIPSLLQERAQTVHDLAAIAHLDGGYRFPVMHSLVYARPHRFAHTEISNAGVLDRVTTAVEDIQSQQYFGDHNKGPVLVVVDENLSPLERSAMRNLSTKNLEVQPIAIDSDISHPEAYNYVLSQLPAGNKELLWMTEAGAKMATKQAFHAGALAIRDGSVAVQGTRLADQNAGFTERAFYNLATRHPQFRGHHRREATAGMGYLGADRSVVSVDALRNVPLPDGQTGPFNTEFGNGGYDGELGERLRQNIPIRIRFDWALSVAHSESLSAPQVVSMIREWSSFSQPNTYQKP